MWTSRGTHDLWSTNRQAALLPDAAAELFDEPEDVDEPEDDEPEDDGLEDDEESEEEEDVDSLLPPEELSLLTDSLFDSPFAAGAVADAPFRESFR